MDCFRDAMKSSSNAIREKYGLRGSTGDDKCLNQIKKTNSNKTVYFDVEVKLRLCQQNTHNL